MQPDIQKELQEQRALIEQIYVSVEKTRKYFLWTMIGTLVAFVLPLLALGFIVPSFLNTYTGSINQASSILP